MGFILLVVWKPEGKRLLWRRTCTWENNIKMDLQQIRWDVNWIRRAPKGGSLPDCSPQTPQNRNLKNPQILWTWYRKFYVIYPSAEISHLSKRFVEQLSRSKAVLQTCMTYTIAKCTVNKLLMMDRGTSPKHVEFYAKINL